MQDDAQSDFPHGVNRRPWLPTSLGFVILATAVSLFAFRTEPQPGFEPQPAFSTWPSDPAITQSLCDFLNESAPTSEPLAPNRQNGVALGLYSQDVDYDYAPLISEIADHRANWVSLFFNTYQADASSTELAPLTRLVDQERIIADAAQSAHDAGLKVMAFPLVLLSDAKDGEWRGNLAPADLDQWFKNYGAHILRLARICEDEGIEAFCVGSEFSSLEKHEAHWRALIKELRDVFSGQVLYSSNWDHYEKVPYWDAVDAIGLSGYYELTRSKTPSLEDLVAAWTAVRNDILAWKREAAPATPIVFTEIGYANQDGTNVYPWNYTLQGSPDPEEQALCYESFIRVWHREPSFGGAFFYNWFGMDSLADTGYSPRGKPAAQLIRAWYTDTATN